MEDLLADYDESVTDDAGGEEPIRCIYIEPNDKAFTQIESLLLSWFESYIVIDRYATWAEGTQALASGDYDVVFSELIFPAEDINDPFGAVVQLMDIPETAEVPVVIISKYEDKTLPIACYQNGVIEFFSKLKIKKQEMEFRLSNILKREYRAKMIHQQINESIHRFQDAHGMSQTQITELRDLVEEMKTKLEAEYEEKTKIDKEKQRVEELFGRYVEPRLVQSILNNEMDSALKGQQQDISVLFSDITGYTTLSESLEPERMVSFLNEYYTSLTEVILGYNGMVDKYIGDAIMALFGAPLADAKHHDNVVEAAMEMAGIFELWVPNWEANYGFRPSMSIGISSGEATVGDLGSFQKKSYTAVGDTVNMASRLESIARPGQILISQRTFDNLSEPVRSKFEFQSFEVAELKGLRGTHTVYNVKHPE